MGPSGSFIGLQRISRNTIDSDNMSVVSSAASISSIGSINFVGGSKKRRCPLAPSSNQKRPLPTNAIPEETPSVLRTEEEITEQQNTANPKIIFLNKVFNISKIFFRAFAYDINNVSNLYLSTNTRAVGVA